MNVLKEYYAICSDILKEHLPCIPELKITNAKGYNGQIIKGVESGEFKAIQLSKFNLGTGFDFEREDYEQLIYTICHEFAHLIYWNHKKEHSELTAKFEKIVVSKLDLINKRMEVA